VGRNGEETEGNTGIIMMTTKSLISKIMAVKEARRQMENRGVSISVTSMPTRSFHESNNLLRLNRQLQLEVWQKVRQGNVVMTGYCFLRLSNNLFDQVLTTRGFALCAFVQSFFGAVIL